MTWEETLPLTIFWTISSEFAPDGSGFFLPCDEVMAYDVIVDGKYAKLFPKAEIQIFIFMGENLGDFFDLVKHWCNHGHQDNRTKSG